MEIQKPLPKRLHFLVQAFLIVWLRREFPENLDVGSELNVLRGADRLVPHVVVARANARYLDGDLADPPELVIEILSPGQNVKDLFNKCNLLLQSGTATCWVVEPEKRDAWNYTRNDLLASDHLTVDLPDENGVMTSLILPVATMWAELERRGL